MNSRPVLFLFSSLLLISVYNFVLAVENVKIFEPTPFQNVLLPELLPEEQRLLEETEYKLKNGEITSENFEVLRRFLVLAPEKFLHEKNSVFSQGSVLKETCVLIWDAHRQLVIARQNVVEKIRVFLETLPPEALNAWRFWTDKNVEAAFKFNAEIANYPNFETYKRLFQENPFSSYDAEFLDLLAQEAWRTGSTARAVQYWEMELDSRTRQTENFSKTHFLTELPSLETLHTRLKTARKAAERSNAEWKRKFQEKNLNSGKEWRVSMTQILTASGEVVFDDLLPEDQRGMLFPNLNRNLKQENEETPQFLAFTPDKNFLAARLGTRISFWPEEEREVRPQSYIVVLDLSRGGQLVWLKEPVSVDSIFIGNPLVDLNFVYIPSLQIGKNAMISLMAFSLADGTLQKNIPLFQVNLTEVQAFASEPIFLPIRWTPEWNIQVGGITSQVQILVPVEARK